MKVQMQGQSLRIRISETELAQLQGAGRVDNQTRLPGGRVCFALQRVECDVPSLRVEPDGWVFSLPRGMLEAYVARLPCREGVEVRLPMEGGDALDVAFEVDVRDSVRSRGIAVRRTQSPEGADRASG